MTLARGLWVINKMAAASADGGSVQFPSLFHCTSFFRLIFRLWTFFQQILDSFLNSRLNSSRRYRAIVCAPGRKLVAKQAWILLSAVWFWSILIGILPTLGWNEYHHGEFSSLCKISTDKHIGYVMLTAVTCFAIPLATMFFCYLRVFLKVRHHRKQLQMWQNRDTNIKSEAKTAKIVFTVLFAFVVMWAPFVIVTIIQASVPTIPPQVFVFFNLTAGAHSACNPVIYATMNRKFRGDMLQVVPCLAWVAGCCCSVCRRSAVNQVEPSRATREGDVPIDRMEVVSA